MTLLETCNADVYKAILDIKESQPETGEHLISILQQRQYLWQITLSEMLVFSAHLPLAIWDRKVHTFYILFQSQQTTVMP
jgi:hypothetical protein